ncbi:MAG: endonuclease NucS [Candidatus Woesearchaeota archaeon]
MELNEFYNKLKSSLEEKAVIVFGCSCKVLYKGRAESFLPEGERIVIIKSDSTLLIHQPKNSNPVNYMKEGTSYSVEIDETSGEKLIVLKATNQKQKEFMDIIISKVYFFEKAFLKDNAKIIISGTEKDMAEMIMKKPELIEEGFKPLSREEHTKYGFIDVFGYDKNNRFVVIEAKRYVGDLKAVSQLRRYVEKIKKLKGIKDVRGILACPKITPNALQMLHDFGFEFKMLRPPKYLEEFGKKQKRIFDF